MRNFTKQLPGEAEVRAFRYDTQTKTLYTELMVEDPRGDSRNLESVGITEESAAADPVHERYWNQTHVDRTAYHICEDEDIPLDEARAKVNGQPPPTEMPQQGQFPKPPPEAAPQMDPEPEPSMSPIAGIIISNQQLILGMAFNLLDQYVTEDDPNAKMLNFLKEKIEELDGHEIIV